MSKDRYFGDKNDKEIITEKKLQSDGDEETELKSQRGEKWMEQDEQKERIKEGKERLSHSRLSAENCQANMTKWPAGPLLLNTEGEEAMIDVFFKVTVINN